MVPAPATEPAHVFCAWKTYSKIGGMGNFNRRVIRKFDNARIEVSAAII
jgi:hypothetical protein